MNWRVELTPAARKDLAHLETELQRRVASKLDLALLDPLRFFQPLRGRAGWKLRVGDLRVLALLEREGRRVLVFGIRPRRNVYDR